MDEAEDPHAKFLFANKKKVKIAHPMFVCMWRHLNERRKNCELVGGVGKASKHCWHLDKSGNIHKEKNGD